jgi:hypothetical protein
LAASEEVGTPPVQLPGVCHEPPDAFDHVDAEVVCALEQMKTIRARVNSDRAAGLRNSCCISPTFY